MSHLRTPYLLLFASLCLSVSHSATASGAEPAAAEPAPQKQPGIGAAVSVNALGFALFGPAVNLEVGKQLVGIARARFFGLGLLSHQIFPADGETLKLGSLGGGLGARYYLSDDFRHSGAYVGILGEYLQSQIENAAKINAISDSVIVGAEGGYRFASGRWFVGLGGELGFAIAAGGHCEKGGTEIACVLRSDKRNRPYGQAVVDIGVALF